MQKAEYKFNILILLKYLLIKQNMLYKIEIKRGIVIKLT